MIMTENASAARPNAYEHYNDTNLPVPHAVTAVYLFWLLSNLESFEKFSFVIELQK
jgi:hypothetical protein